MPAPAATSPSERTSVDSLSETEIPCCVPAHGQEALQVGEAEALAARFKALADPNRLRILSIVSTSAAAETCVCDLPEPLKLSQPTVSHHLKILVEAGLLNREKRGVWAYYSLVPGALDSLAAALAPRA
ncbi:metalloregulator ArsR/SmtB family transcription factor [Arthrobacter sp.]|uniref:ArsR/SmtB family transcription factor n=1 Tax=Arthrobacter sp. TaxID=1667 RepID=UPI00289CB70C|nr:metalloregulator ArsR/SmtB family transcription factor [Arthrobacter sp.]